MLIIATFSLNTDKNEGTFTGNISMETALVILQKLVIANEIRKAKEQEVKKVEGEDTDGVNHN